MNIASRLDSLERQVTGGTCPQCGQGDGPIKLTPIVLDGDSPKDNRPDVCPACGRRVLKLAPITLDGGREL